MPIRQVGIILLAITFIAVAPEVQGQTTGLPNSVVARVTTSVDEDALRLQSIFKDIHQNPELGFMETRTAAIVANELRGLGYTVKTGIGKTGVVGILENGEGPTVMFRADMDANAVEERTGLPWASNVRVNRRGIEVPVGHLCGHDAHVTWLISIAKTLSELKDSWRGTVVLVAQPAEELIEGAAAMVADGLYAEHDVPKPQYFVALHTMPATTGLILVPPGLITAGTEQIDVKFFGVGGHGSSPQYTKDPVVMSAMAIAQYQMIVSRIVDPRDTAVLTVGAVLAGADNNVIPDEALLKLNLRFFDEAVHQRMVSSIDAVNNGIARTYGMPEERLPTMTHKGFSTPLANTEQVVGRIGAMLPTLDFVEADHVIRNFRAVTSSEDAHLLVKDVDDVEILYLLVGTAPEELVAEARKQGRAAPFAHHSPYYQVDLEAIPYGAKVGAVTLLELLGRK